MTAASHVSQTIGMASGERFRELSSVPLPHSMHAHDRLLPQILSRRSAVLKRDSGLRERIPPTLSWSQVVIHFLFTYGHKAIRWGKEMAVLFASFRPKCPARLSPCPHTAYLWAEAIWFMLVLDPSRKPERAQCLCTTLAFTCMRFGPAMSYSIPSYP
jgi:hypothetical protein